MCPKYIIKHRDLLEIPIEYIRSEEYGKTPKKYKTILPAQPKKKLNSALEIVKQIENHRGLLQRSEEM